jgi:FtsH-binding integral membrane protein
MESIGRNDLKSPAAIGELQRSFVLRVYGWMTLGLAITAAASLYTLAQPNLLRVLFDSPFLFWGLLIIELVLVLVLSAKIGSLGVGTARVAFLSYAALTGISLTPLVLAYTASSLFHVFVITAGLFGAMCLYGHVTRRDLTAWSSYLFMFLAGLILASVANLLLGSAWMDWLLSLVGVIVFIGLSAYDAQAIRRLGATLDEHGEVVQKAAVIGALSLYLDFVNLFLRLLQLFGERRDD